MEKTNKLKFILNNKNKFKTCKSCDSINSKGNKECHLCENKLFDNRVDLILNQEIQYFKTLEMDEEDINLAEFNV